MRSPALAAAAASLALVLSASLPAAAQDPLVNSPVDATLVMRAKGAAVGVGYTWGNGTLVYHHHQYPFTVKGISVADVGFSSVTSRGRVYHLSHLADFSGTYAAATGQATVGQGLGGQILRNGNGVMIRVDQVTKGARLEGSAGGIQLTLVH